MQLFEQVKSFRTAAEVDDYLFNNPMHCPGALHFEERNATVISYGIQTNSTYVQKRGYYEDPTFKFQIPLQIAAEREIARSLVGGIRVLMYHCSIFSAEVILGNSLFFFFGGANWFCLRLCIALIYHFML